MPLVFVFTTVNGFAVIVTALENVEVPLAETVAVATSTSPLARPPDGIVTVNCVGKLTVVVTVSVARNVLLIGVEVELTR